MLKLRSLTPGAPSAGTAGPSEIRYVGLTAPGDARRSGVGRRRIDHALDLGNLCRRETGRRHRARVPWSSLQGICSLDSAGKIVAGETMTAMADTLVTGFLAGLRNESSKPMS